MARHHASFPLSAIALGALIAFSAGAPATAAEQKPPTGAASVPQAAVPNLAVPLRADLSVTMAPLVKPYQRPDGTNCIDFRPGTVVVSNTGKAKASGFRISLYWNYGGPWGLHSPMDNNTLGAGASTTLLMDGPIYAHLWCPGVAILPAWRVVVDDGNHVFESNEGNNVVEKSYTPPAPRQPRPKAR